MEHPIAVAFCPILFGANGGQFTELGKPIFERWDPNEDGIPVKGLCDTPYDCGTCPHMAQWVAIQQANGWIIGWECFNCLKQTRQQKQEEGPRFVPGFYQEGRPPDPNSGENPPALSGCTKCGYPSSFLQIVLRKPGV